MIRAALRKANAEEAALKDQASCEASENEGSTNGVKYLIYVYNGNSWHEYTRFVFKNYTLKQ